MHVSNYRYLGSIRMRHLTLYVTAVILLSYSFLQMDLVNPLSQILIHTLRINHHQYGLLASLYFYVNMLLLLPAGFCLDRYGVKSTVAVALAVALTGLAIFLIFPSYATAIVWRSTMGVLGAVSFSGPMVLITKVTDPRWIARTIACFGLIIMSTGILAQTSVRWVTQQFGISTTLWLDTILGMILLLLIVLQSGNHSRQIVSLRMEWLSTCQVIFNLRNLRIALFASLVNLPLLILGAGWGSVYLTSAHNLDPNQVGRVLSMVFAGHIVGDLGFGYLGDIIKKRLSLLMMSGGVLYLISLIGLMPRLFPASPIFLQIALFLIGLSLGCQILAYAAMIDAHPPSLQGKATSLVTLTALGLGAVMQMVCGYIDMTHVHILLMLCAASAIVLSVFVNQQARILNGVPIPE